MNHLINKYRKNELSRDELHELGKELDSMTDEEVGQQLYASWLEDDQDTSFIDNGRVAKMKNRIDVTIRTNKKRFRLLPLFRWLQIAAAILLPVSLSLAIYFYRESNFILDREILFTTGKAERASVTLPDGTVVSLNMESTLKYRHRDYNKKTRIINFDGEGYFQVFHNKKAPFFVHVEGMQIKVLGTVFNLSVRKEEATAELALEDGCVSLLSDKDDQAVILHKNQKAILDRATGHITVVSDGHIGNISAWRYGDMIFRNADLSQIIRMIEKYYDVTIKINCKECAFETFSGTLPIDNLNETIEILEQAYHLKAVRKSQEIVMKTD
ncbi:MAG: FecR domain-containing protein [Tannerellaceae bacterium]|jgi:ferric-dicitrate binding protein FerR (iron transport regulator)|nr:FecR domain-containing protein [Tannerellaceae bacterium]